MQACDFDLDLSLDLNLSLDVEGAQRDADPLADVKYGNGIEKDTLAELAALRKANARAANPDAVRQFDKAKLQAKQRNDSEYWCALCFQSREQKEEFLKALGILADGDKYLDGVKVAEKMKITLPTSIPHQKVGKIDPKLAKLAR